MLFDYLDLKLNRIEQFEIDFFFFTELIFAPHACLIHNVRFCIPFNEGTIKPFQLSRKPRPRFEYDDLINNIKVPATQLHIKQLNCPSYYKGFLVHCDHNLKSCF